LGDSSRTDGGSISWVNSLLRAILVLGAEKHGMDSKGWGECMLILVRWMIL